MEECRFEHGDCVIHSPTGGPTTHRGPPALCSHAAADLERRLAEQKALTENAWKVANDQAAQREQLERRVERAAAIEVDHDATYTARVADLESRIARLELEAQTYAEVAAGFQQEKIRLEEEKATLVQTIEAVQVHRKAAPHGDCACQVCDVTRRLAQAEAREATMRDALRKYGCHQFTDPVCQKINTYPPTGPCTCGLDAALFPDAGRAKEVNRVDRDSIP